MAGNGCENPSGNMGKSWEILGKYGESHCKWMFFLGKRYGIPLNVNEFLENLQKMMVSTLNLCFQCDFFCTLLVVRVAGGWHTIQLGSPSQLPLASSAQSLEPVVVPTCSQTRLTVGTVGVVLQGNVFNWPV